MKTLYAVAATATDGRNGHIKSENGGFGLAAWLPANIPGVSIEEAQSLIEQAHQVCPYSNATKGNMEVKLTVSNNH